MLIWGRRQIVPREVDFSLLLKASKKRIRLIVSYSRLLGLVGGVDGGIVALKVVVVVLF
jgi:hypothetical protein